MSGELVFAGNPSTDSGMTVTATVYTYAGASVSSGISCTESTTTANYVGNFPGGQSSGKYIVKFFAGPNLLDQEIIEWDGSNVRTFATQATAISAIPTGDTSGVTTLLARIIGTLAAGTHNPQSGDSYARLGAPVGASIAADIAAISGGGGGSDSPGVTTLLTRVVGTIAAGTHNPQSGDSYSRLGTPAHTTIAGDIAAVSSAVSDPLTNIQSDYTHPQLGFLIGKLDVGESGETVVVVPSAPADPTTVRLYGYFKTPEFLSPTEIPVLFTIMPKVTCLANSIVVPQVVQASIIEGHLQDSSGNYYVTLIMNDAITPDGTQYLFEVKKFGISKFFTLDAETVTDGVFDLSTLFIPPAPVVP